MLNLRALTDERGGSKALQLSRLMSLNVGVPHGFVVLATDDLSGVDEFIKPGTRYVVRSSASGEDGTAVSFAGQLDSIPDVVGEEAIRSAICEVRDSVFGERALSYADGGISVHTVVQEQVHAVASGVIFTRNPVTGLDERVVEAVAGSAEGILSGGVEPDRWVWRWGAFTEQPVASPIDEPLVREVINEAEMIASEFDQALDLEWVFDGAALWWVQCRPITAADITVYSSRISREVLPGAIKPLVWSVNIPLVNGGWIRLFDRALGPTGLEPDDLAKSFGYHAYFNMTAMGRLFAQMGLPEDSLELLLGLPKGPDAPSMRPPLAATIRLLPRLLRFGWQTSRARARTQTTLAESETLMAAHRNVDLSEDSLAELLDRVSGLSDDLADLVEANIVVPILMNGWSALLRRAMGDLIVGWSLTPEAEAQVAEFDPRAAIAQLSKALREGGPSHPDTLAAQTAVLGSFGHLSESGNDFSVPTWAEQPDLVLRMAEATDYSAPELPPLDEVIAGLSTLR